MNPRIAPWFVDSRRALAVLVLVLAGAWRFWPPALTAGEPERPSGLSAQELRLTLDARSLLAADAKLSRLNLGVQVRGGVATVYGPVTTAEIVDRTREVLKSLKGIREVRNELTVLGPDAMPTRDVRPPRLPPEPTRASGRYPRTSGTLQAREPVAEPVQGPKESVELLPPVRPVEEKKPAVSVLPPPVIPDLRATIDQMRQAEPRFRNLVFEVRGAVVYLRGSGPDVKAFAQVAALVPGVERVALVGGSP